MGIFRFILLSMLLCSCSSWEKVEIEQDQCNSEEVMEKFKEKTLEVLSKISNTSRNFYDFSKMDKVRCMGHDFPTLEGPVCAKKCRPYAEGNLTEKSDAVEVVISHLENELMVVEVSWVPGAIENPTAAPPKKLVSDLMPAKGEKPKEEKKTKKKSKKK